MNRGQANVAAPTEPPIPGGKALPVEVDGIAPGRERDLKQLLDDKSYKPGLAAYRPDR